MNLFDGWCQLMRQQRMVYHCKQSWQSSGDCINMVVTHHHLSLIQLSLPRRVVVQALTLDLNAEITFDDNKMEAEKPSKLEIHRDRTDKLVFRFHAPLTEWREDDSKGHSLYYGLSNDQWAICTNIQKTLDTGGGGVETFNGEGPYFTSEEGAPGTAWSIG